MTLTLAPDVKEVPGPTSWLPGGNFLAFRRNPLTFFTKTARTYGDVARFSFGSQPVYLVSHPAFIEDILVTSAKKFMKGVALQRAKKLLGEGLLTSEGQMHLRRRRTIQPLFHRQQVQTLRRGDGQARPALARDDHRRRDDRRHRGNGRAHARHRRRNAVLHQRATRRRRSARGTDRRGAEFCVRPAAGYRALRTAADRARS